MEVEIFEILHDKLHFPIVLLIFMVESFTDLSYILEFYHLEAILFSIWEFVERVELCKEAQKLSRVAGHILQYIVAGTVVAGASKKPSK